MSLQCRYHSCVLEWRQLINSAQASAEVKIIDANNLGAFYRFVNKRIANRSSIGVIVDGNSRFVTDSAEKANLFNSNFSSVTDNDGILPNCRNVNLQCILEGMTFESVDVLRSINDMKGNCSSGPDGLPPLLFKKLKYSLCQPLAMLYNQFMSVAYVPCAWKSAVVVPVFKKGVSGSVQNYRPISLTCIVSKIMERIVSDRITNHLVANNILHSAQHGFLNYRSTSTTTNLIECFNDWTVCVQDRRQMTVVYIDFRKAFDVLSHEKLFHPLYHYGIRGNVLLWLKNFQW